MASKGAILPKQNGHVMMYKKNPKAPKIHLEVNGHGIYNNIKIARGGDPTNRNSLSVSI
jgi:hypothetical protein